MKGACHLSAVPMRAEPSDKAELVNQVLYGESFEIIDNQDKWTRIRLDHDQYEGWIDCKQWHVTTTDDPNLRPLAKLMYVIKAGQTEQVLSMGSLLSGPARLLRSKRILPTARQFLGVPYLWGGRTFMGIDCSGFTQIVFRVNGKQLPRDAWQQAERGRAVRFANAKDGDLAFFRNDAGRIVHVGIVYKEDEQLHIIHASGEVRCDRLDEQGILNESTKQYTHTLHSIKRIRR